MATPRKKYKPKPINPTVHLLAMQGAARLTEADRLERTNRLAAAVEVACMGLAAREHWSLIVDSLNMAEMFARHKVAAGLDAIYALQDTVETCLNRARDTGTRALRREEQEDLRAFAEAYADLLRGVTHRQYFEAQEAAENRARRILAGERFPASRVLEC